MINFKKNILQSDKTGIASALLCTLHCLAIPALVLVRSSLYDNNSYEAPAAWHKLDYVFMLISFWAVYHSSTHTSRKEIKIALWLCWAVLATSLLWGESLHWMTYFASAGLITTHLVNLRQTRKVLAK